MVQHAFEVESPESARDRPGQRAQGPGNKPLIAGLVVLVLIIVGVFAKGCQVDTKVAEAEEWFAKEKKKRRELKVFDEKTKEMDEAADALIQARWVEEDKTRLEDLEMKAGEAAKSASTAAQALAEALKESFARLTLEAETTEAKRQNMDQGSDADLWNNWRLNLRLASNAAHLAQSSAEKAATAATALAEGVKPGKDAAAIAKLADEAKEAASAVDAAVQKAEEAEKEAETATIAWESARDADVPEEEAKGKTREKGAEDCTIPAPRRTVRPGELSCGKVDLKGKDPKTECPKYYKTQFSGGKLMQCRAHPGNDATCREDQDKPCTEEKVAKATEALRLRKMAVAEPEAEPEAQSEAMAADVAPMAEEAAAAVKAEGAAHKPAHTPADTPAKDNEHGAEHKPAEAQHDADQTDGHATNAHAVEHAKGRKEGDAATEQTEEATEVGTAEGDEEAGGKPSENHDKKDPCDFIDDAAMKAESGYTCKRAATNGFIGLASNNYCLTQAEMMRRHCPKTCLEMGGAEEEKMKQLCEGEEAVASERRLVAQVTAAAPKSQATELVLP